MRKILNILSILVISAPLGTVVACKKMYGTDLSKVSDFNWSGDEPYFQNNSEVSTITVPSIVTDLGKINVKNHANYMNLATFNTGFNTTEEIQKQASTGVPLNSKFLPNGQSLSSVQEIDKKDFYTKINRLVDWKYEDDNDAKYNTARISLQKTAKVKTKWVASQDENIAEMNMSTIIPHTSMRHTIVGNNRTFERSFNNYQYNDVLVSWAGAMDEGIIVPAAKNQVEKAHLNGTKILGNIFLDGYHGLTKEKLSGFLQKDSAGNYLVVDVLINIATQLGFDGWFWNNEPNGAQPNGAIVDYNIMIEVMHQLQQKIKTASDQKTRDLIVYGYRNQGTLEFDQNQKPTDTEANLIWKNTNYFLNDFYKFPTKMQTFMKANGLLDSNGNPTTEAFKVFNMINAGAWVNGEIYLNENRIGTTDFRQLTNVALDANGAEYDFSNENDKKKFSQDYMEGNWTYKSKAINSLSIFAAQNANDLAEAKLNETKSMANDTYGLVYANNYDDMLYTGRNKALSDTDEGVSYYPNPKYDEKLLNKSYGVGNLVQEKTTLIDENKNFLTNFSTGQGNQFKTLNSDGTISTIKNYPWSNTNIAETQPTYKWKVSSKNGQLTAKSGVSGFYDYYNPYLKGNSIALGGGYDSSGQISDGTFEANQTYDWTIMGADYSAAARTLSMVVKADASQINLQTLTINTTDAQGVQKKLTPTITSLSDGWIKLSSSIGDQVSQIGLGFTTKTEQAKINVGQLGVEDHVIDNQVEALKPTVSSEYLVERNLKNNLRLNFSNLLDDNVGSYYEVYQKNANSLTMVGQSNANNYYIKNISTTISEFYVKTINRETNSVSWIKFQI